MKRELIHGYYASTSFVDSQIGRVMDELDRLKLNENTIVVLWGDHGFHLGDLGIWTKHTNYEQANRIPILISAPGVTAPNSSTKQLAESVDIFPTLAELAGLPQPSGPQAIDGVSLVPVLKDPQKRVREYAYHAYPKKKLGRAIRTERYRLVQWREFKANGNEEYELYDYQTDPLETRNLAKDLPDVVTDLKKLLAKHPDPVGRDNRSTATKSPTIANRELIVRGRVRRAEATGVVVAHGGRENGYAVHLLDGHLAFDVRVNGKVTRIVSAQSAPREFTFQATLGSKKLELSIDGRSVATDSSPGLIPVQPKDGMDIGRDNQTAAGNYESPNPLIGKVERVEVKAKAR